MKKEILDKYMRAGGIVREVRGEVVGMVRVGGSLLEVAEFVENRIRDLGGMPAFPCNISRNDEAAHATPSFDSDEEFGEDMVKVDIGAHIDGWIADSAITVDLSGNGDLVRASEDALAAAIEIVREDVNTTEIGEVIEGTIRGYGFIPIMNLTGHGLAQYDAHTYPPIPNRKAKRGVILKEDDVIAIEPFATDGAGSVRESTGKEIYQLVKVKTARSQEARELLREIEPYKTLPFAKRWFSSHRTDFALKQLERIGAIKSFPVLKEVSGGLISQAEHTVIVQKEGCEVTT
jgi:methionyl aminopeptidase